MYGSVCLCGGRGQQSSNQETRPSGALDFHFGQSKSEHGSFHVGKGDNNLGLGRHHGLNSIC